MRKWLILGAIAFLLLGAGAVAVRNFNSYLNQNKAWLTAQAAAALGRQVDFDEIGVSLVGGFGARVTNLRVADDPTFSTDDFVQTRKMVLLK